MTNLDIDIFIKIFKGRSIERYRRPGDPGLHVRQHHVAAEDGVPGLQQDDADVQVARGVQELLRDVLELQDGRRVLLLLQYGQLGRGVCNS